MKQTNSLYSLSPSTVRIALALKAQFLFSKVTHRPTHFELKCTVVWRNQHFCMQHQNLIRAVSVLKMEAAGLRLSEVHERWIGTCVCISRTEWVKARHYSAKKKLFQFYINFFVAY